MFCTGVSNHCVEQMCEAKLVNSVFKYVNSQGREPRARARVGHERNDRAKSTINQTYWTPDSNIDHDGTGWTDLFVVVETTEGEEGEAEETCCSPRFQSIRELRRTSS